MIMYYCNACREFTEEGDMKTTPALRDEPSWMLCACGSDDFTDARPCDECDEITADWDFEDGTDLCGPCWEKENPDTGVIESQHMERLRGIS